VIACLICSFTTLFCDVVLCRRRVSLAHLCHSLRKTLRSQSAAYGANNASVKNLCRFEARGSDGGEVTVSNSPPSLPELSCHAVAMLQNEWYLARIASFTNPMSLVSCARLEAVWTSGGQVVRFEICFPSP